MPVVVSQLAEALHLRWSLLELEIRAARVAGRSADAAALEAELRVMERLPTVALERHVSPGRTGPKATVRTLIADTRARIADLTTELRAASARKRNR